MSDSANYLVNVSCPHCTAHLVVAISGFGGELAVRAKECRHCRKEFFVQLITVTTVEQVVTDGSITTIRDRIKQLSKMRKQTLSELLIKHEQAQLVYRSTRV